MKAKIVVLGGGISGLVTANAIQALGYDCILLERCPSLGGLTRTVKVGEFCFDYTGHFLHLNRWKTPADIPFANLTNNDWQQVDRQSFCYLNGRLIPAPIQYNLAGLPHAELKACVKSYESRPTIESRESVTFRNYIISGFGQHLADSFLIPQNEKTLSIPIDRLSIKAVNRFFPAPDEKLIRDGIKGRKSPKEYNSSFWYPVSGGIGTLVQGLASGINDIRVNQEVKEVDLKGRCVYTRDGSCFEYNYLFSSAPLPNLLNMCNDQELLKAVSDLTFSSTICMNLGLKGALARPLREAHWIYVPDRNIPFYRVGFYSNISSGCCTPGYSAMYVEVGVPGQKLHQIDLVKELEPKVFRSLELLGWLDPNKIVASVSHTIPCAYVHHTPEREATTDDLLKKLESCNVYSIGRYGLWDYTSMEDSMISALDAVEKLKL